MLADSTLPITIVVVDYGMGNIHSMLKALRLFASQVIYSADVAQIARADALVLPGDGAFGAAMQNLSGKLQDALLKALREGQPLLGVCIGFQILFRDSDEYFYLSSGSKEQREREDLTTEEQQWPGSPEQAKKREQKREQKRQKGLVAGLDLIPGEIRRFSFSDGQRIPHIGWNRLLYRREEGLKRGDYMYFVHSYYASGVPESYVSAYCQYGDLLFPAMVRKENITATQFHPEKSAGPGLELIAQWVKSISSN